MLLESFVIRLSKEVKCSKVSSCFDLSYSVLGTIFHMFWIKTGLSRIKVSLSLCSNPYFPAAVVPNIRRFFFKPIDIFISLMWQFVGLKCFTCDIWPTNRKHPNIRSTVIERLLLFPGPKQANYKINIKCLIPLFNDAINCWDHTATVVNEWISIEHSEIILIGKDRTTRWRKPVVMEYCPPQIRNA